MRNVLSFVLLAFLSTTVFAQTTWTVDKAHSQVSFGIDHMGISEVEGLFKAFDAEIVTSKEDFSDAVFNVTIDAASVDTGVEMRDNHLKNADFFDVDKYPRLTFKSNNVERVGDGKYKVTGDLNFHGVTKPVILDVWYRGTVSGKKGDVSGFQVTGSINRSDFNFGSGFPAPGLGDEVRIKVDGEFKTKV